METMEIFLRIGLAVIVGGSIGYEREMRNRPAGFVTHTLVCVGAAVVGLIQMQMIHDTVEIIKANPEMAAALKADVGRIVSQVVTGVGFLGAGTIMFDKGSVKGLTTATTLWVVASLGISIGLGYYRIAVISGLMVLFIMVILKKIETMVMDKKFKNKIVVSYLDENPDFIKETVAFLRKNRLQVRDIKILGKSEENIKRCEFVIYTGKIRHLERIIAEFEDREFVISIRHK